jgi:glycogen synthase
VRKILNKKKSSKTVKRAPVGAKQAVAAKARAPRKPKSAFKLRIAMCAWEIGRVGSGLGVKIGGLGQVVEELPPELVKAAARAGGEIEIETLSPCFNHYDKSRLTKLPMRLPAFNEGVRFLFDVYQYVFKQTLRFPDGSQREVSFKSIYFWDPGMLNWTGAAAIYPHDPWMGTKLYAAVGQAMAGYIQKNNFQTVHLHDYHVGFVPFFLGDEYLKKIPVHLTIHNAGYQGITPLQGGGFFTLDRLGLPGFRFFHKYFDFFDNLNLLKACALKVHENGGRVTTVSGDLAGTWGYAAELRENHTAVYNRAWRQKGVPPGEIFVPNRHLDLLEKIPVAGITNGLAERNLPKRMPELKADELRTMQAKRSALPLFENAEVQKIMLEKDHTFDASRLDVKDELRKLLYQEAFGHKIWSKPVLISAVGRLVEQKNFGLIARIVERTLTYDPDTRFIILAKADDGDEGGKIVEQWFGDLSRRFHGRVSFRGAFNPVLAKLIMAGSDFTLVPSRFEPCGLVDYEAAVLGTIPICRATGGLTKIRHCGYLYEWLDIRDAEGEAAAFFDQIREAIRVFRFEPQRHRQLLLAAMKTNVGWKTAADQYLRLYKFGLQSSSWRARRRKLIKDFVGQLKKERTSFAAFHAPGYNEYGDRFDWELKEYLER